MSCEETISSLLLDEKQRESLPVGGPIFDEDREIFSAHIVDPSYGLFNEDGMQYNEYSFIGEIGDPIFDVIDNDDAEVVPIYDLYDEDEMKQVMIEKVEDESLTSGDPANVTDTPKLLQESYINSSILTHEDSTTTHGIIWNSNQGDLSTLFQNIPTMVGCSGKRLDEHCDAFNRNERYIDSVGREHVERDDDRYVETQRNQNFCDVWSKDCKRQLDQVTFDIHENHGGALIDKFIDFMRKDNDTFEQESFTLSRESSIGDSAMLPVMCVSAADKKKYFRPSWNCGSLKNLVFRQAWQQYTDVMHNERSNELSFYFVNFRTLVVGALNFSPWRLSVISPLEVNQSVDLRNFSSTYGMKFISCARKDHSDLFKTMRKKCDFCVVGRLIFSRVTFFIGALVDLLEVEPARLQKVPFVIAFHQCMVHSFFSYVIILTWDVEESEFLYQLLDHKPFVFLPSMFTTVLLEFMYAVGLHWRPYQERLRFMCIITFGSSGDVTVILTAEVSQFVRPVWLMVISRFSPLLLRPYCSFHHVLSSISFVKVLIRIEADLCAIHIGSVCVQPRLIFVLKWCCVTVLKAHELIWVSLRFELLCCLKSKEQSLRTVVFGEILAYVYIYDNHLPCVISDRTEGVSLILIPHELVMTFTLDSREDTRLFSSGIVMSYLQVSPSLWVLIFPIFLLPTVLHCEALTLRKRSFLRQQFGSRCTTHTTLTWWSDVTCMSSKLLCVLDVDVSFRTNTSFSWSGAFECVHIFSHNMVDGREFTMLRQRLEKFYKISWLCDEFLTCNQVRWATHGHIKFLGEDVESSAESVAARKRMLLLEVCEQIFSLNDSTNAPAAAVRRRRLVFDVGDLVWVYFTRDRMPAHTYNKLKSVQVGPLEVENQR
ncbi:hypothetical protein YC2023_073717 [Brassica napus]